jgi:hypothetical protein
MPDDIIQLIRVMVALQEEKLWGKEVRRIGYGTGWIQSC